MKKYVSIAAMLLSVAALQASVVTPMHDVRYVSPGVTVSAPKDVGITFGPTTTYQTQHPVLGVGGVRSQVVPMNDVRNVGHGITVTGAEGVTFGPATTYSSNK